MKIKHLLTKTLLLAVCLLAGASNVWATDVPYNVGSSTSDAWGTAFSDVWTMTGDGAVTVTFTNHCATDGNWWDNWQLLCGNENYTPAAHDDADRYFKMRSDRWEDAANSAVGFIMSDDYFTDFKTFQNEATVTMKIVRSGSTVTVNVSVTKSATTHTMTFVKTGLAGTLNFFLTQSLSYMEITQQDQITEMAGTISVNALVNFDGATITSNTINGGLGSMSWSGQWTATPSIDSDMLRVGNMNDGIVALVDQPGSKDIVTISFDLGVVNLSGKSVEFKVTDKNSLVLVDEEFNKYDGSFTDGKNTLGFAIGDFVSNQANDPGMVAANKNKITLTFNYNTRKISCSLVNKNGTVNKQIDMPVAADAIASFAVRSNYNNASRRCYFDNLLIQTEKGDYNTTANITFTFKDNEANDISALYTGISAFTPEKGSTFKPSDYYPTVMYDENYKYTYTSGGDDFTVTTDQLVTLVYTKSARPTYTLNVTANYGGNSLKIADDVVVKEAGDYTYYYPRFIKDGTTLYKYTSSTDPNASASFWTSTLTNISANTSYDLTYEPLDGTCVYYAEGEDIAGATAWAFADYKPYMSNGNSGAITSATTITTLDAGVYSVTARAIGRANDRYVDIYKSSADDENKVLRVTSQNQGGENTANFTLTGSTDIIASGGYAGGASGHACDYISIMQLPASVPATIGTTGYTTFASSYAMNLDGMTASEGTVKAYYVTASDVKSSSVALTGATGNVAAGTGLILEGTAGATITIPVVAAGTALSGNKLVGCTTATDITSATENYGNFYVLSATEAAFKKIKNWVDAPNTLTIPAGKAYLDTTGADVVGAPTLNFDLSGEATGIADVRGKMEDVRSDFFDLQGRKVAQPAKGLYIVNGKKVVIK